MSCLSSGSRTVGPQVATEEIRIADGCARPVDAPLPRRRHLVGEGESGDEAGPPLAPGGAARLGVANRPPKKNSADTETDGTVSADTDKESDASSSTESGAAGGVEGDKEVLGPTTPPHLILRGRLVGLSVSNNLKLCRSFAGMSYVMWGRWISAEFNSC